MDEQAHKDALQKDINVYKALNKVNKSEELNAFIDLVLKTVVAKMYYALTNKKAIQSYEDFLELRAEITSYLYPIQEVRGAKAAIDALEQQIKDYYQNPYDK